jgi:hypothetical protein
MAPISTPWSCWVGTSVQAVTISTALADETSINFFNITLSPLGLEQSSTIARY